MNRAPRRHAKGRDGRPGQGGPDPIQALFEIGLSGHRAGNNAQAQMAYRRVLIHCPSHHDSLHLLGVLAYQQGDHRRASGLIEAAILIKDDHAFMHNNLGVTYQDLGQLELGNASFVKALILDPAYPEAHNNLGKGLVFLGKPQAAHLASRRALILKPDFAEAHINRGLSLAALGQRGESLHAARCAIILRPEDPAAYANLGTASKDLKNLDAALRFTHRAIAIQPGNAESYVNLAAIFRDRGELDQAIAACRAGIASDPDLYEAHVNQCFALRDGGRIEEAWKICANFIGRHPLHSLAASANIEKRLIENYVIMAASLMITGWLSDNYDNDLSVMAKYIANCDIAANPKIDKNMVSYAAYLDRLQEFKVRNAHIYHRSREEDEKILFVIGESHSLAPCNAVFDWRGHRRLGQSLYMMGLKMWHLAMPGRNYRRSALESRIAILPRHADFLVTVGEIDCRPDEGIWLAARKNGRPVEDMARHTVGGYLSWLDSTLSAIQPSSVTIQGIPAPAYDLAGLSSDQEKIAFLAMIRGVNALLRDGAARRGWWYLDVHGATRNLQGTSNGEWAIDSHHLRPDFYISEAARHMIAPGPGHSRLQADEDR